MSFLNETLHPQAEELTALLFALSAQPQEDRTYEVLENWSKPLSDNAKADLYARLEESEYGKAGKVDAVTIVSKALWQNQKVYPRGW